MFSINNSNSIFKDIYETINTDYCLEIKIIHVSHGVQTHPSSRVIIPSHPFLHGATLNPVKRYNYY